MQTLFSRNFGIPETRNSYEFLVIKAWAPEASAIAMDQELVLDAWKYEAFFIIPFQRGLEREALSQTRSQLAITVVIPHMWPGT